MTFGLILNSYYDLLSGGGEEIYQVLMKQVYQPLLCCAR